MLIYYVAHLNGCLLFLKAASGLPYPKDPGCPKHLTCLLYPIPEVIQRDPVLSCTSEDNHMEPFCVILFPEETYIVLAVSQVLF